LTRITHQRGSGRRLSPSSACPAYIRQCLELWTLVEVVETDIHRCELRDPRVGGAQTAGASLGPLGLAQTRHDVDRLYELVIQIGTTAWPGFCTPRKYFPRENVGLCHRAKKSERSTFECLGTTLPLDFNSYSFVRRSDSQIR
jgi:hypothetical protein